MKECLSREEAERMARVLLMAFRSSEDGSPQEEAYWKAFERMCELAGRAPYAVVAEFRG